MVSSNCRDASCLACLSGRDFLLLFSPLLFHNLDLPSFLPPYLLPHNPSATRCFDFDLVVVPSLGTADLLPSERVFFLLHCIYFGHLRRQTSIIDSECTAYYLTSAQSGKTTRISQISLI